MNEAMKIGERYNWIGQPERLVYLGRNWSGNGYWHQFEKVGSPGQVWCEVLDSDLRMFEKTKPEDTLAQAALSQQPITSCNFGDAVRPSIIDCLQVKPEQVDGMQQPAQPDGVLIDEGNMLAKEKYSDIVSDGGFDIRDRELVQPSTNPPQLTDENGQPITYWGGKSLHQPAQPSCEPASIIDTEIRLSFSGITGVYQDDEGNYVRLSDYEALKSEHSRKMLFVEAFEESSNRVIQELKSDRGELRKSVSEITCELGLLREENTKSKEKITSHELWIKRLLDEGLDIIDNRDSLRAENKHLSDQVAGFYGAIHAFRSENEDLEQRLITACKDINHFKAENAQLKEANKSMVQTLRFVERWANHHADNPRITDAEALSCIQHYPRILDITRGYADGKVPATPNPFAERDSAMAQVDMLTTREQWIHDNATTSGGGHGFTVTFFVPVDHEDIFCGISEAIKFEQK